MKVALIFPPDWNSLWMPYSSTPSLKAYLKEGGVEAVQYDFNIEAYDLMLRPEPLMTLWKKTAWSADIPLPMPEAPNRKAIKTALSGRIDAVAGSIEEALSVFRTTEKFSDPEQYSKALQTHDDAMSLIFAASSGMDEALKSPAKAVEAATDPTINVFLPYLEKLVGEIKGDIGMVGISVVLPRQMVPAMAVASLLRKKYPKAHIALGGAYPTLVATAIENSPELFKVFDSVAISEGEIALLGLAKAIESGEKTGDVPGILFLEGDKVTRSSLPVMEDADILPTPDFDQLPLEKYLSPEPVLPAFSSRGCYWRRCTYCIRPDRRTFSQRSPQQVVKDLTVLKRRYKARAFHFTDNAIRPRRMAEIADAVGEAELEVSWAARTRFSPELTWDWCDQVAAGGCARIMLNVQSASKRVLDLMDEGFRIEDVPGVLQGLSKAGVDVTLYFVAGFPGEKADETRKTLQFTERLQDTLTPYSQFHVNLFAVAHGCIIHQEHDRFGIKSVPDRAQNDLSNPFNYEFAAPEGMNRQEAVAVYREMSDRFSRLVRRPFRMPHDMIMRLRESQETVAKSAEVRILKLESVPKLAEDIRAEKGYLLKGKKRFRIDESLRDLISLLDSRRTVKEVIQKLSKARKITAANAFIYIQTLYGEGIIEVNVPPK